MSAAEKPSPFSVVDGKYALIRELGSGSSGTVYEAENLVVGKKVALKLLRRQLFSDSNGQARFIAEARAAARISHANVVDMHDLGITAQGSPFIVMELLRGETLEELIETRGPLALTFACELFLQLLAGLSAAHAQGVVHGDLRPENVIVTRPRPERPLLKLLDFGVASGVRATQQRDQLSPSALMYLSPEQVSGDSPDFRSDVYQASAVLFAMLGGGAPFEAAASRELLKSIGSGRSRDLRALLPELPLELLDVLKDGRAVRPRERIQSAEELAERVRPFVSASQLLSLASEQALSAEPLPLIVAPTPVMAAGSGRPAQPTPSVIPVDMPRVARLNHSLLVSPRIPRAPSAPKLHMGRDFMPMPGDPVYQELTEARRSLTHSPRRSSSFKRDVMPALLATGLGFGLGVMLAWSAGLL